MDSRSRKGRSHSRNLWNWLHTRDKGRGQPRQGQTTKRSFDHNMRILTIAAGTVPTKPLSVTLNEMVVLQIEESSMGISPPRLFCWRFMDVSIVHSPSSDGMKPERWFWKSAIFVMFGIFPISEGIGPVRALFWRERSVRIPSNPSCVGIEPESRFFAPKYVTC